MRRRAAILSLPALLSACATSRSVDDGTDVPAGSGLLVVHVSGMQSGTLGFNPYGESSFGSRFAENMVGAKGLLFFEPEGHFVVRPLEAGEYMWTKLATGNQYAWLLNSTRFSVARSTITYIGHLRVLISGSRYGVRVFDREADTRAYLTEKFPKYSSALPFKTALADVRLGA